MAGTTGVPPLVVKAVESAQGRKVLGKLVRIGVEVDKKVVHWTVVGILQRGCRPEELKEVLEEAVRYDVLPQVRTVHFAIDALQASERIREARKLLRFASEMGMHPHLPLWHRLIEKLGDAGHVYEKEWAIKELNEVMDVVKRSRIDELWLCSREGNADGAEAIIEEILTSNAPLGVRSWNFLAVAYRRSERGDAEEKIAGVIQRMQSTGITPDETAFNLLLRIKAKRGDVVGVEEVLKSMEELSVKPDDVSITYVVSAYSRKGDLQQAEQRFFHLIRQHSIPTSQRMLNSLIAAYARSGEMQRAKETASLLKKLNMIPTIATYNALLSGTAKLGDLRASEEFFRELQAVGLQPNDVTCGAFIQAMMNALEPEQAYSFLKEMKRKYDVTPKEVHVNLVIEAFSRCSRKHQKYLAFAEELVENFADRNLASYLPLVRAYSHAKNRSALFNTINRMVENCGHVIPKHVYKLLRSAISRATDKQFTVAGRKSAGLTLDHLLVNAAKHRKKKVSPVKRKAALDDTSERPFMMSMPSPTAVP